MSLMLAAAALTLARLYWIFGAAPAPGIDHVLVRAAVWFGWSGIALFFCCFVGLCVPWWAPAYDIIRLMKCGQPEVACELAERLLVERPKDIVVKLNSVGVFVAAGHVQRAKQVMASIDHGRLRGRMREICESWRKRLDEQQEIEKSI